MAAVIFSGVVLGQMMRVVDKGAGLAPRLVIEQRSGADAMGTFGWSTVDPISRALFEALLLASGVVT